MERMGLMGYKKGGRVSPPVGPALGAKALTSWSFVNSLMSYTRPSRKSNSCYHYCYKDKSSILS